MSQSQSQHSQPQDLATKLESCLLKCLKSTQKQKQIPPQTITQIHQKIQQISTSNHLVSAVEYFLFALINHIDYLRQAINIHIEKDDYQNLEESVQKAEAEIRKHIRLEQQLKIYLDGLEEKVEQLERQLKVQSHKYMQLFQSMKAIDIEKRQLKKKLNQYQIKFKLSLQKQPRIHLSHKASKILSEPSIAQNEIHGHQIYKTYNEKKITKPKNFLQKSMNFNTRSHQSHNHSRQQFQQRSKQHRPHVEKPKQQPSRMQRDRKAPLDAQINVSLGQSPRRKQSDKTLINQMTRTIQLKQSNYKKNSRKLLKYSTDQRLLAVGKKADARSNSVCY